MRESFPSNNLIHSRLLLYTLREHFFGKIQNRTIEWDYTDSFLRKKQKIQKRINRGLIPAKETKKSKGASWVHFFGKNPNPDSESKNGFFFLWQNPKRDYESNESVRDEDSMD